MLAAFHQRDRNQQLNSVRSCSLYGHLGKSRCLTLFPLSSSVANFQFAENLLYSWVGHRYVKRYFLIRIFKRPFSGCNINWARFMNRYSLMPRKRNARRNLCPVLTRPDFVPQTFCCALTPLVHNRALKNTGGKTEIASSCVLHVRPPSYFLLYCTRAVCFDSPIFTKKKYNIKEYNKSWFPDGFSQDFSLRGKMERSSLAMSQGFYCGFDRFSRINTTLTTMGIFRTNWKHLQKYPWRYKQSKILLFKKQLANSFNLTGSVYLSHKL